MRKILISILIVALLVLIYFTAMDGLDIFGIRILSIQEIVDKNDELNNKIEEVSQLASVSYPKSKKELDTSVTNLLKKKDEYADLVSFSSSEEVDMANRFPKYDMEYLRTRFGTYATKNGVKIKIDVMAGATENQYNLNFTATGSYVGITEFIAAIEKDTSFSFRIEKFKLTPLTNANTLQGTFAIQNVLINNINKVSEPSTIPEDSTTNNTTNTTNTTGNTTNTTDNTNTTQSNS